MTEDQKESGFNREDSAGANNEESYKNFVKDKRKRISETGGAKVEYRPREYTPRTATDGDEPQKRNSYNPNFTRENRPAWEKRDNEGRTGGYNNDNRREYTPREGYEKREYTPRNGGERREYTPREGYQKREYTPRDGGERREYTPREGEERREYTPREGYQKREYTPRDGGERRPYGDRPSYPKREYTPREGYEKREYAPRDGGERREYTPRGDGERRPYGDRPSYNKNREQGARGEGFQGNRQSGFGNKKKSEFKSAPTQQFTLDNYPTFPTPPIEDKMRLNRYISMSGICSRREADEFIASGVVTVNGEVVTELGTKVSAGDVVKFNDNLIQNEKKVYIVMNKPKGYVTSVEDPHADKTVMELLHNGCRERVYPVGRLDKNSLGVLLITNDGDLAKRLTHPSFEKKKIYQVSLDKALTKADMQSIADGITLEDGDVHADAISYVGEKKTEVGIEIHSGRNRIVRRIFEHLGYRVQKLDRVYFAGLTKQRLKRGSWRFLTPREVQNLLAGRYE